MKSRTLVAGSAKQRFNQAIYKTRFSEQIVYFIFQVNSGAVRNACCIFPFKFAEVTHNSCITLNAPDNRPWCSTQVDGDGVHVTGRWGHCNARCPGANKKGGSVTGSGGDSGGGRGRDNGNLKPGEQLTTSGFRTTLQNSCPTVNRPASELPTDGTFLPPLSRCGTNLYNQVSQRPGS